MPWHDTTRREGATHLLIFWVGSAKGHNTCEMRMHYYHSSTYFVQTALHITDSAATCTCVCCVWYVCVLMASVLYFFKSQAAHKNKTESYFGACVRVYFNLLTTDLLCLFGRALSFGRTSRALPLRRCCRHNSNLSFHIIHTEYYMYSRVDWTFVWFSSWMFV